MCKRYPTPEFTLDVVIANHRLLAFINQMLEETEHEEIYGVWLHKVYDKNFNDFKNQVYSRAKASTTTDNQKANTIKDSFSILENFAPTK